MIHHLTHHCHAFGRRGYYPTTQGCKVLSSCHVDIAAQQNTISN